MIERKSAPIGTTVYEVERSGVQVAIFNDFHGAMMGIAHIVSDGEDVITAYPRFAGLDTAELSGSLYHRIRYETGLRDNRDYEIREHHLDGRVSKSLAFHFKLLTEFDPSYIVQEALYKVSNDEMDVEGAADWTGRVIKTGIEEKGRWRSNDLSDAYERMRTLQYLMGGEKLIPDVVPDDFDLASVALDRFRVLAVEAFPPTAPAI
jgi:hypothetical protein